MIPCVVECVSARMESELETEALRKYLAEVEAAAAGLQSRVQELEHLIKICGLSDFSYYALSPTSSASELFTARHKSVCMAGS